MTALLGTCPVCGELVWEGDWVWVDKHIHPGCWEEYLLAELSGLMMEKHPGSERLRPLVAELTRRTRDRAVEDREAWTEAERLIRCSFEKAASLDEFIVRIKPGLLGILRR